MAEFVFSIALVMALPGALVMTGLFFLFMGLMAIWIVGMIIQCAVAAYDTLFITNRRQGCLPEAARRSKPKT